MAPEAPTETFFRNRHGEEGAAYAGGDVDREVAAIAIHAFQNRSQDIEAIAVSQDMKPAAVEEHRHDQTPVLTAAQVGSIRSAKVEEDLRVIGSPGIYFQTEKKKVNGKQDDRGDRPVAARGDLVILRAWG